MWYSHYNQDISDLKFYIMIGVLMEENKFILFDRDGVINVEKSYLYKIEDFEYETGVIEGLKKLKKLGYRFLIITNQAGIAKGYYTEEDYLKLEKFIMDDLENRGIKIEKTYYCPHHPEGKGIYHKECECRKPNIGNFLKAINEFFIDVEKSFMVGDRITDLIPAEKLGFKTVMVKTGYGMENISKLTDYGLKSLVVENVNEFADLLIKKQFVS